MEEHHHRHRGREHRDRAEEPQQQRRREVERPQPQGPEIAAAYDGQFDVLRRNVGVGGADEVIGVDEAAGGLYEAGEGEEEADQERDVLDRHRRRPRVAVDELTLEDVRVVGDPRADQRAQG